MTHKVTYKISLADWSVDSTQDPRTELISLETLLALDSPADVCRLSVHSAASAQASLLEQAASAAAGAAMGALGLDGGVGAAPAFSVDAERTISARRYLNLEENLAHPQSVNFVEVSGAGTWHGSQHKSSSYLARFPVMGPYIQVFVYNRAPVERKVSVWGYLVS